MPEIYGSHSASVVGCVSVTILAATYPLFRQKPGVIRFCAVFNVCIVWISLKTLSSAVLVTFAGHLSLLCFLTSSQWTMDKKQQLRRLVCRTSYSSYDSSLVVADYQRCMACDFLSV